jgi:hypothetical protein
LAEIERAEARTAVKRDLIQLSQSSDNRRSAATRIAIARRSLTNGGYT